MNIVRLPRIGAVCALLYVLVFVGGQAFLSAREHVPNNPKLSIALQEQAFLRYMHQHLDLVTYGALFAILGYVLLAAVAWALFVTLRARSAGMARLALAVGVIGIIISTIAAVVEGVELTTLADQFARAATTAARQSVTHDFDSQSGGFQVIDLIGNEGIAAWMGLVGLILLRSSGRSSIAGWASIGGCLLQGLGLPVLVAWVLGAGVALWRLDNPLITWSGGSALGRFFQPARQQTIAATVEDEPEPVRPSRPVAAQGSKTGAARRRRRKR